MLNSEEGEVKRIYYGFMTAFIVSPGYIFVVHVGIFEKESQKQIATMTGFHYGTIHAKHIKSIIGRFPNVDSQDVEGNFLQKDFRYMHMPKLAKA